MSKKTDELRKIHAVRLVDAGTIACGPYRRGVIYPVGDELSLEEANRLVEVKGFEALTAAQVAAAEKAAADKDNAAAGEG